MHKTNEKALYLFIDSWLSWRLKHPSSAENPSRYRWCSMCLRHPPSSSKRMIRWSTATTFRRKLFTTRSTFFQGHPPVFPPRPMVESFEGVSTTFVSIVFAGNTKPFADRFDAAGSCRKKRSPLPGSDYPEWYRVFSNKDISTQTGLKEVYNIFEEVLVGAPVFVRVNKSAGRCTLQSFARGHEVVADH